MIPIGVLNHITKTYPLDLMLFLRDTNTQGPQTRVPGVRLRYTIGFQWIPGQFACLVVESPITEVELHDAWYFWQLPERWNEIMRILTKIMRNDTFQYRFGGGYYFLTILDD